MHSSSSQMSIIFSIKNMDRSNKCLSSEIAEESSTPWIFIVVRNTEGTKPTKVEKLSLGKYRNANIQKSTCILGSGGEGCLFYIHFFHSLFPSIFPQLILFLDFSATKFYYSLFLSIIYQSFVFHSLWSIIKNSTILSIANDCFWRMSLQTCGKVYLQL